MKNKLMIWIVVLVAISNTIKAQIGYSSVDPMTGRWTPLYLPNFNQLEKNSTKFFNEKQRAQQLLSMAPKKIIVEIPMAGRGASVYVPHFNQFEKNSTIVPLSINNLQENTTKFFNEQQRAQQLLSMAPRKLKVEMPNTSSKFARLVSNAKVAVVAAPAAVVAGGLYALDRAQAAQEAAQKAAQVAEQAALNSQTKKLAKAKMIDAEMAEQKANIEAGIALQSKGFRRVKNAISDFGSSVKTQVLAHPRIAGAGLATVAAGFSYLVYTKYGKAILKRLKAAKPTLLAKPKLLAQPKNYGGLNNPVRK